MLIAEELTRASTQNLSTASQRRSGRPSWSTSQMYWLTLTLKSHTYLRKTSSTEYTAMYVESLIFYVAGCAFADLHLV